ncbi:hypothetical protein BDY19DRAFT_630023 [Irpex rosettiformis]|uniref:Uncharacterized protein n=1 Tax=Irpex rosettiformis TaxID=378272 RepID=A0ACB8UBR3_9APHY|nr:hypothetical protein BDY19DRAFT_630023 [Irpex rosettiformis]
MFFDLRIWKLRYRICYVKPMKTSCTGQSVSLQILTDLLGVDSLSKADVDRNLTALPRLSSRLSARVHSILATWFPQVQTRSQICDRLAEHGWD